MSAAAPPHLFNIAPDLPFLDILARKVLAGGFPDPEAAPPTPEALVNWRIYVPTRRAAGMLKEAFLRQSGRRALLLPVITPLGDPEEDELVITGDQQMITDDLAPGLPPAISALERRLVLTRLIRAMDEAIAGVNLELGREHDNPHNPAQAVSLAGDLGRLMDSAEIDQADWSKLATLVPEHYARNWQLTLEFLKIATGSWPEFLTERNLLSPMARRNALLLARAAHFEANPPAAPVIAAGSTGSTPATARLLGAIASLPRGAVVLPGLDPFLDAQGWEGLGPDHPQYGMAQLLTRLDADRKQVAGLKSVCGRPARTDAFQRLASEMMRPAAQTHLWKSLGERIDKDAVAASLDDLSLIEAPDAGSEARCIALIMRQTLEHKSRTAALVTPDRALARRVAAELMRWGVRVEDSSGRPLRSTLQGRFLLLVAEAVMAKFAPQALLALLKHPFCTLGMAARTARRAVLCLDLALRGPAPADGLAGIAAALKQVQDGALNSRHVHRTLRKLDAADWAAAAQLLVSLKRAASVFAPLFESRAQNRLKTLLRAHIEMAQALSQPESPGTGSPLWQGEAGEAAMNFLAMLDEAAGDSDRLEASYYSAFIEALMNDVTVRPKQSHHPRLFIWGALEARLQHADVTILGSLNEGVWPSATRTDPWLSRPMREHLGLEPLERRIGLSAHDFAQALCSGKVYLTRAQKIDGTPSVPSRWLLRLQALLKGLGMEERLAPSPQTPWLAWCEALGDAPEHAPISRPAPCPPVKMRPRSMSVTAIERWIRDPYEIYAKFILKLAPLDPLEMQPDARLKGIITHDILQQFIEKEPAGPLSGAAAQRLLAIAAGEFEKLADWPELRAFWQRRFEDIAEWFLSAERLSRERTTAIYAEKSARLEVPGISPPFTLSARADRIDILKDASAVIIDYKTGAPPTEKMVRAGLAPQLPLEAALLEAGAFEAVPQASASALLYMKLSGGEPAGKLVNVSKQVSAMDLARSAMDELAGAIALYDRPETPYVVRRMAQFENRFSDYDHLARTKEWRLLATNGQQT